MRSLALLRRLILATLRSFRRKDKMQQLTEFLERVVGNLRDGVVGLAYDKVHLYAWYASLFGDLIHLLCRFIPYAVVVCIYWVLSANTINSFSSQGLLHRILLVVVALWMITDIMIRIYALTINLSHRPAACQGCWMCFHHRVVVGKMRLKNTMPLQAQWECLQRGTICDKCSGIGVLGPEVKALEPRTD